MYLNTIWLRESKKYMNLVGNMKNILLTGGFGFFGNQVYNLYQDKYNFFRARHQEFDLLKKVDVEALFAAAKSHFNQEPFGVIHLAGFNGGIVWNKLYPADIYMTNIQMGNNLYETAKNYNVEKLCSILSACAFPVRTKEAKAHEILQNSPHDSIMCHGYAKRHLELLTRFYSDQYKMNCCTFCPPTMFGPGDKTDVSRCKFISAVIIKMLQNPDEVTFMGDGSAYREILYTEKAAEELMKCYDDTPCMGLRNVPTICEGVNKTIKQFVNDVAKAVDYKGKILWDGNVDNNGQNYKSFSKPWNFDWDLGWYIDGLNKTIEWYKNELGYNNK